MVQILHLYFKKNHQLISYGFSAEKENLVFFPTVQRLKKSHERDPVIRLLTPNGISELFLINIFEINVKFGF
jgi:hypothetical protein